MNWIKVLELGGEGGSITLLGQQNDTGVWYFTFATDESTMAELLSDEDAKELVLKSKSEVFEGLDNAIEKLSEKYAYWANFYPEFHCQEFSESICHHALSQKRCRRDLWEEILMETNSSPAPVATVEQYKKALLAVRDSGLPASHLVMLKAQCRAPNSTITATQLAEAAGFKNYNAANLQYGTLASNVAAALGYNPEKRPDGTPMCWTTLSYSVADTTEQDTGHFQFIMRPEFIEALRSMRWA